MYVGLSSFYVSVLSMLNLAELGFGAAVAFSLYEPIAKEDHETVRRILRYFKRVYRIIGLMLLVLGFLVMPFLGYLISGDQPTDVNLQLGFLIYLLNTAISYLMFGYRQTLIIASQRNDVVSKIQTVVMIVMNVFQIAALYLYPNFYLYIVLIPLMTIVQNLVLHVASNKLFPHYKESSFLKSRLTKRESKAIRERVLGAFVYRVCQITRDSCDMIFISMFLGLSVAGCYSNYFIITNGVLIVLEVICQSMTAPVGHSIVSESTEKNFKDLRLFMFMYASVAVVCLACLLCLYQPFMELWVGEELMLPDTIVWLLCGYFYMRVMGDIRAVYVDATGLWWKLKGRSIIEAIVNVVLNFILVQLIGLPGVIIATVLSMFVINYLWGSEVIFTHYFKNGGLRTFFIDNLKYLAVTAVCVITPYLVLNIFFAGAFLKLIVGAALAVILSSAIWMLFFGHSQHAREAKRLIGQLRR